CEAATAKARAAGVLSCSMDATDTDGTRSARRRLCSDWQTQSMNFLHDRPVHGLNSWPAPGAAIGLLDIVVTGSNTRRVPWHPASGEPQESTWEHPPAPCPPPAPLPPARRSSPPTWAGR